MSMPSVDPGDLTPDEMYRREPLPLTRATREELERIDLDLLHEDVLGDETVNPSEIREAA